LFREFIIGNNFEFRISNFESIFNPQFSNFIFAAFVASLFFYSIIILTKGKGMGGGDVKLAFLMGLILGCPVILLSLFLSFIFGSIVGIFLILVGKKKMKSMIPFGPFLIIGTFIGLFWGKEIIGWYLSIIIY
jgi:prepilin signal peptidase PulO-like enzyme (type II secretory pathway)